MKKWRQNDNLILIHGYTYFCQTTDAQMPYFLHLKMSRFQRVKVVMGFFNGYNYPVGIKRQT